MLINLHFLLKIGYVQTKQILIMSEIGVNQIKSNVDWMMGGTPVDLWLNSVAYLKS